MFYAVIYSRCIVYSNVNLCRMCIKKKWNICVSMLCEFGRVWKNKSLHIKTEAVKKTRKSMF